MVRWKKIAAVLAPVLLLSACGSTQSASSANDSSAGPNAVISVNGTEPQVSLVPMNTGEVGGDRILSAILAGLVAYDPSGKPVNEVAESITPNSDATQFTVKIKDGWKFTDGTPVTSESFTKAWSYAANVTNAQLNSSYFSIVKGYDELQKEGTPSDAQLSGLVVKDDHTFQINLNAPDSALPSQLGSVSFLPVPEAFYKDPKAYGEKPIGNGAYKLVSWKHGQGAKVIRNDDYKGNFPAKNGGIDFRFYTTLDSAYADVQAGNLDLLDQIPATSYSSYQKNKNVKVFTAAGSQTQGISIPERLKHFSGEEGILRRQAISLSIDRDLIIKKLFYGTRVKAVDYSAPSITGYTDNLKNKTILEYNPQKGKELWKKADAISPWDGTLSIAYNADSSDKQWIEAVLHQLQDNLGVDVQPQSYPTKKELRTAAVDKTLPTPYQSGWAPDYPNIENYLTLRFSSDGGYNEYDYHNDNVDKILAEGSAAPTTDDANAKYQEAEEILLNDLPQIPLWYQNITAVGSKDIKKAAFTYNNYPMYADLEK